MDIKTRKVSKLSEDPKKGNSRRSLWYIAAFVVLFGIYSQTIVDFNFYPRPYSIPFPATFEGPFAVNNKLSNIEYLFEGKVNSPESIVFHNGSIYTGTGDGYLIKISGDVVTKLYRAGKDCAGMWEENICGRPLGLRLSKNETLYFADGFYGLYEMDIRTGEVELLLPTGTMVEGKAIKFPDDLDIDDEGMIYFSDASTKWTLLGVFYIAAENDNSGRVIKFDPVTKKTEVIMDGIHFANGVQLSHDRNSLLVCEFSTRRILRFYLRGPKKGEQEIFVDTLPGEPDNIRLSSRGGYWVALTTARNRSCLTLYDYLAFYPKLKRVLGRIHYALAVLLESLVNLFPFSSNALKERMYTIKRGDIYFIITHIHSMAVELNENGQVIQTLQSPEGKAGLLSQVQEHEGYIYLGSYFNNYLGRAKL